MHIRVLTLMLAGFAMLGPFSIDTYLPSFPAIAADLGVDELLVQQTLSTYLFAFAFMMLFHGTLSDSFGRRPIVLIALAVYTCASIGASLAPSLQWLLLFRGLQGMSAGAGIVVGRAIVRDRLSGADAQRMLANITMVFGIAPAIAPILGGWLQNLFGWHSVFVFLSLLGLFLLLVGYWALPESLPPEARQALELRVVARNYCKTLTHPGFLWLAASIGFGFAGFGLYVAAAPDFVMNILGLSETAFAWLFVPLIGGMILGAWMVSRTARDGSPLRFVRNGFILMSVAAVLNLGYSFFFPAKLPWAVLPVALYTFGMSLIMPSITLKILDLFPQTRGLTASLQSFVQTTIFAAVAALSPIFFGSALKLAAGQALGLLLSLGCYLISMRFRMRR